MSTDTPLRPVTAEFSADRIAGIRSALLAFYDAAARLLPWRRTSDPYAIWVSEIMAQQTRVDTVVPYFERWLQRFPDVATLAAAPIDDVMREWEGLGYYSRARNLHAAAGLVRERHAGTLPATYAALRALPGIGDYTAGAIASIAFGERQPAVDGNVRRVISRLLDQADLPPARLRVLADSLVPADRPGDFNQAMMELGATVCTPARPLCASCPLHDTCAARAAGTQLDRPRRVARKAVPTHLIATAVLHRADGTVFVRRRPDTGLLAGLWSFPGREVATAPDAADGASELAASLGCRTAVRGRGIGTVEHVFSHRRERYLCYAFEAASVTPDGAWIGAARGDIALPRGQQRIHTLALESLGIRGRENGTA